METCTVETGLLRKTPCGGTAVAKCANCEQPLCSKHAVAQLSAAGKKTGAFMCAQCNAAQRQFEKTTAAQAAARTAPAAAKPPAPRPPAGPPKPAAAGAPAKPAPAAAPPKPAAPKPPEENSDGSIDFTPSKK